MNTKALFSAAVILMAAIPMISAKNHCDVHTYIGSTGLSSNYELWAYDYNDAVCSQPATSVINIANHVGEWMNQHCHKTNGFCKMEIYDTWLKCGVSKDFTACGGTYHGHCNGKPIWHASCNSEYILFYNLDHDPARVVCPNTGTRDDPSTYEDCDCSRRTEWKWNEDTEDFSVKHFIDDQEVTDEEAARYLAAEDERELRNPSIGAYLRGSD